MSRGVAHVVSFFLAVLALPISVVAQSISLPVDGYYRPGAYFPVELNTTTPVTLRADAGMTTAAPAMNGIVPVFVFGAAADSVRCGDQTLPLHVLGEDDRLIGCTTHDDALIHALFPTQHAIISDLDPTHPLAGPAVAWDALDAVILDSIDPSRIAPMLATGAIVAVRTDAKPDSLWPWKRVNDAWVLRPIGADRPALLGESAYEPIAAWMPERSAAARQVIVILAVLCGCGMLAISLWRSRWMLVGMAIFAAIFCASFQGWRATHGDVLTRYDGRRIAGEVVQFDCWGYQTSPVDCDAQMKCDGVSWPVFASSAHAALLNASMMCDQTGNPRVFLYRLPPNAKMAFVTRDIQPVAATPASPSARTGDAGVAATKGEKEPTSP